MPIDHFLQSLAEDQRGRAIGVILAGTATDGSVGLKAIKAEGGITFAQDPGTAKYNGMPRAAIASGAVDFVLPPEGIAGELAKIGAHPYLRDSAEPRTADAQEPMSASTKVFFLLRRSCGVDFTLLQARTIRRRILRRMALHRIDRSRTTSPSSRSDPRSSRRSTEDILINVTRFFRDPERLRAPEADASSRRCSRTGRGTRRSASGCRAARPARRRTRSRSRLLEFLGDHAGDVRRSRSSGPTSASWRSRRRAPGSTREHRGRRLAGAAAALLHRRSTAATGSRKAVRDICVFARQDVTRDPPFSKLDLDQLPQRAHLPRRRAPEAGAAVFHYALKPTASSCSGTRRRSARRATSSRSPTRSTRSTRRSRRAAADAVHFARREHARCCRAARPSSRHAPAARLDPERGRPRLLDRYAPAGVIVERATCRSSSSAGRPGRYLEPAPGDREPERPQDGARGARARAPLRPPRGAQEERPVAERGGLACDRPTAWRDVDFEVIPLRDSRDERALPRPLRRGDAASAGTASGPAGKRGQLRGNESRRRMRSSSTSSRDARVPPVDHRGAGGDQRGAPVGERGDPLEQRGAPEHERGARDREGGAAVDERGAEHRQRGAPDAERGAEPASTTIS